MSIVQFDTNVLFYRIYKSVISPEDYLNWSYSMLRSGIESKSLLMLSSMNSSDNIFSFEDYFNKSFSEVELHKPTFMESARSYITLLCTEIVNSKRDVFEVTKEIFKISVDLEYPEDLSVWLELDDNVDWIVYDNKALKQDESVVRQMIIKEAKRYLATQEVEDYR
ncbi:hypothetical protein [Paenibacillus sp. YIM B09110]|uniref:hypothetical protein n=1 Tax=Paenibacillus sp. YIM B09110 TaxID=3126102 RepID=UPI00301BD7C4